MCVLYSLILVLSVHLHVCIVCGLCVHCVCVCVCAVCVCAVCVCASKLKYSLILVHLQRSSLFISILTGFSQSHHLPPTNRCTFSVASVSKCIVCACVCMYICVCVCMFYTCTTSLHTPMTYVYIFMFI